MITIAIANYNYGHFICQTIDSALKQTYKDIEILVYDDASTDDSVAKIQEKYGNKVKIIQGKKNYGAGYARNHLINQSRGSHIFFLDSDDLLTPNAIEKLLEKAQDNDVVFGMVDSFSTNIQRTFKRHVYVNDLVNKLINHNDIYTLAQFNMPCNKLISIPFLRQNNIVFSNRRFGEDALFGHLLAFAKPKCGFINDVILKIRQHDDCLSSLNSPQKINELFCVTQELINANKKNGFRAKIKLDGNILVYAALHIINSDIYKEIIKNKYSLSISSRILIALKLFRLTKNYNSFRII